MANDEIIAELKICSLEFDGKRIITFGENILTIPLTEAEMKTLTEIERILRDQKPILKEKFKVREIGIFGSVVRGEQKETSDLDLLVEFEEPIGLIKYVGLQNFLSDKIGARVDLVVKSGLKPRISRQILKEVIYV